MPVFSWKTKLGLEGRKKVLNVSCKAFEEGAASSVLLFSALFPFLVFSFFFLSYFIYRASGVACFDRLWDKNNQFGSSEDKWKNCSKE